MLVAVPWISSVLRVEGGFKKQSLRGRPPIEGKEKGREEIFLCGVFCERG